MRQMSLTNLEDAVVALRATGISSEAVRERVQSILAEVLLRRDGALRQYTKEFDHVELPDPMAVPGPTMERALAEHDPEVVAALRLAAENIRTYHEHERPHGWRTTLPQNQTVGQEIMPMRCAGLYVPGGLANYPSSVLMTAIPAQVAGVEKIVVCSAPRQEGLVAPGVATACALLGLDLVLPLGGAQAIAAMAFGTESVPRCDVIVGPGNAYVTEAKRQVMGSVAIDGLAGPSEVMIVADESAEVDWVAADVLAQAEHGAGAMGAVLMTDASVADRLRVEIMTLADELAIDTANVFLVDCQSLDAAIDLVNAFGPEHLELHVSDPEEVLSRIHNAGAIFLGGASATAFADYAAGTNHVLPTSGSSRFGQGLSVQAFLRRVGIVQMDDRSAGALAGPVSAIAREEGLRAHARAVELRAARTPSSSQRL
jgi:histidinol dehydrogenase